MQASLASGNFYRVKIFSISSEKNKLTNQILLRSQSQLMIKLTVKCGSASAKRAKFKTLATSE